MTKAKSGDTVRVHYTGRLEDNTVFEASDEAEPLEVTIGSDELIVGFGRALVGMAPGETKTQKISAEEAFGPYREALVQVIKRTEFPTGVEPKVGQRLGIDVGNGQRVSVRVMDVSESEVKLDANHPLAGRDLTFDIKLVEIL